jgi:purine-binding chemotaxis protein CheW
MQATASAIPHHTSPSERWATFTVAGETFAMRVDDVQEVLRAQVLTPVPLSPPHIVGLLNLRGQIMTAIDLRKRLGLAERPEHLPGSILVVSQEDGRPVSVVVDDIGDVLDLPTDRWQPPPPTMVMSGELGIQRICPVDGALVIELRIDALGVDEGVA